MWKSIALFLYKNKVSANTVSFYTTIGFLPFFYVVCQYLSVSYYFWGAFFILINIKLIFNAIDGIIAEISKVSTKSGKYFNLISDIIPDIYILFFILYKLYWNTFEVYGIVSLALGYFILEWVYLYKYNKPNVFFGKEWRVIFLFAIPVVYYWEIPVHYLLWIYIILFLIHHVWIYFIHSE